MLSRRLSVGFGILSLLVCAHIGHIPLCAEELSLPETIVIPRDARAHPNLPPSPSALPTFRSDIEFSGHTLEPNLRGRRPIEITIIRHMRSDSGSRDECWAVRYPAAQVGMILPLCGGIGRIEATGRDIRFKMLPESDCPNGMKHPRDGFPLLYGTDRGVLRIDRIGRDVTRAISVDLTHTQHLTDPKGKPTQQRELFTNLRIGSTFKLHTTAGEKEYTLTQIVMPNEKQKIVGWIIVAPKP
jgi:hypothetical protein